MSRITKQGKIYTSKEMADIQQPIDKKTGWTNPYFDKLYGKEKNPWAGTERDRAKRKRYF